MKEYVKHLFVVLMLIASVLTPKRAVAQETILWQAFQHAGVSFGQGVSMAANAMSLYAHQIFSTNPELARALHQWAGPVSAFIEEQIRTNPAVREMVARQIYTMADYVFSEAGKRAGATMAGELTAASNWHAARIGAKTGAADPRVLAVIGVGIVSGIVGHQVGQSILERWKNAARKAEVDAEAAVVGLMLARLAQGTVKLCGKRSIESAITAVAQRVRSRPDQFYKGILCRAQTGGVPPCPTRRCGGPFSASRPTCLAHGNGSGACPPPYHSKNRYGCCKGW